MLVLSRRVNEKIIFPSIKTVVQVVSMKSGTVRLGIAAPADVPVYREEILDRHTADAPAALPVHEDDASASLHQINNRLNCTSIGLALLRRQLDLGMLRDMTGTISKVEQELGTLKDHIDRLGKTPRPAGAASRRRALLVEDDHNERELLAGFLRLAGLEVDTAGDGADALEKIARSRPDVVVLDMMMPRCDGPSTLRAIRSKPDHAALKVYGVTGADPRRFGLPEGPGGITRWFCKPLNPEALLRDLQRELSQSA